jgi:4-aminobutyrate aminotransferase-like enzyme
MAIGEVPQYTTGRRVRLFLRGSSADELASETSQAWILDVDGVRLVIDAFSTSASATVGAELRRIVESIQIEP